MFLSLPENGSYFPEDFPAEHQGLREQFDAFMMLGVLFLHLVQHLCRNHGSSTRVR